MLIAKRKCIHEQLQAQFLSRKIKKRYKAILEKEISQDKGEIHLPLAPDPSDRPRQQVSHTQGKPAHTTYEVEEKSEGETRIALYPHTGRTHQLRVHAAHPEGLHAPIRGDKLYGATHTEGRLCLHADRLEFRHPRTGEQMIFEISTPF
jgi:tRNA pseudouridine32 synthase/23S rRNA pseudouridine746 synthase